MRFQGCGRANEIRFNRHYTGTVRSGPGGGGEAVRCQRIAEVWSPLTGLAVEPEVVAVMLTAADFVAAVCEPDAQALADTAAGAVRLLPDRLAAVCS